MRWLRASFVVAALLGACAHTPDWQKPPHDLRFQRTPPPQLHAKPKASLPTDWWYTLEQTTTRPLGRNLSVIHWVDKATGGPLAHDINDFGEVLDSPWFQNRISRGSMSVEAVIRGPNTLEAPEPPFEVLSSKIAGASPGLRVRDAAGHDFLVKFDPPAYPGLASSAELITTKILHAAGYNVPENYVVRFSRADLRLGPDAMGPGHRGPKALTDARLDDLVMLTNPSLSGQIQGLFSRIVEGTAVGPFSYEGTRRDDPNDAIPHERRRSLRAYRWFCAWTNNTDARASNSLDVFRTVEGDQGYLVHYLLDFGNALGSLGTKPKYQSDGYEPIISWGVLAELFFSAGLRYRYWLPAQRSPLRSVGMFEAEVFDPGRWSPSTPNTAFQASTPLDDFWAASILARFTRPMVEGIVSSAAYSKPEASRYIAEVLWERRRKIMARAFEKVAPLVDPIVDGRTVRWTDLAVQEGFRRKEKLRYEYMVIDHGTRSSRPLPQTSEEPVFTLPRPTGDSPFLTLSVWRLAEGRAGPKIELYLREVGDQLRPVGLHRSFR